MITGLNLVEWQLEVASGNPIPLQQHEIPLIGHAFEARIYAENPRNKFLPDVGPLLHLSSPPPSSSLRIEEGFEAGSNIEVYYDPLISKVVAHGRDRTEALRVLKRALERYEVVGVSTNVEFLMTLTGNTHFIDGEVETGFIQKHYNQLFPPIGEPSPEAFLQAALYVVLRDFPKIPSGSWGTPWETLGAWRIGGDVSDSVVILQQDLADEVLPTTVRVRPSSSSDPKIFDITIETPTITKEYKSVRATLDADKSIVSTVTQDGKLHTTVFSQQPHGTAPPTSRTGEKLHVFHNGIKQTLLIPPPKWLQSRGEQGMQAAKSAIRAPMPSLVVDVRVNVGDKVQKGQVVVVLESMKTETALRAEVEGVVKVVGCKKGDMVAEGLELIDIDAAESD